MTEGVINFRVEFTVTLAEMKEWPPARIAQFFRGITTATKAREGVPESESEAGRIGPSEREG